MYMGSVLNFLKYSDIFIVCFIVGNVKLPPWSSNPVDFVQKHRAALETAYVSYSGKALICFRFFGRH
jgi:hypothetical protein